MMKSLSFLQIVSDEFRGCAKNLCRSSSSALLKKRSSASSAMLTNCKPSKSKEKVKESLGCGTPTIAINGFGRIGKCILRLAAINNMNVIVINQPFCNAKKIANSLSHDSVHGVFSGTVIANDDSILCINGRRIRVSREVKPEDIKWKDMMVDYVIDASGKFTNIEDASKHIMAGAKKVIITTPSKDAPTFVKGVNFGCYKKSMTVVSSSSCTTNCAAPLLHMLNNKYGVENCQMTTMHAAMASQKVHDGLYHRATLGNIIPNPARPTDTIGSIITELKNKVFGDGARVPVLDVSLLKLYINLKNKVSVEDIKCEIQQQSERDYAGLIACYQDEDYVSSDFVGSQYSAIVDLNQIHVIDNLVSISAWYDNEIGYSHRVLDLLKHMMIEDKK